MIKRDQIIEEAKKWVDVPYKHAGRNEFGIDCVGPVIKVAHGLHISTFDITNYSKRPTKNEFTRIMGSHMKRICVSEAKNGDVLVGADGNHVCHAGFLEIDRKGQEWYIHAYRPAKKVIREAMTPETKGKIILAFRYYGVED